MMDGLLTYWPLLLTGASVVVWVVRVEAKAAQNTREIERLWEQRKADLDAARDDRAELKSMLKEVRDDIKALAEKVK